MKILEWMHHKFRHNNIKPFKDLNIGSSCIRLSAQASLNDQDPYTKPDFRAVDGFTTVKRPKHNEEDYFSRFEVNIDEETSAVVSEFFHGFLTIGTLGSDASLNEPATPTFATPLENITDGTMKVTENELKLINYELEKFLEAESKEGFEESARNSNASIITLGGKQAEREEEEDLWKTVVFPLQEYLFQSSIELPEKTKEPTEPKKEEKAPLGDFVHGKDEATGNCAEKSVSNHLLYKYRRKSAMHFMKKIMKKVCPSSKSSPGSASGVQRDSLSIPKEIDCAPDSVAINKKPHKVLSLFHRKIHPESSMPEKYYGKTKNFMAKNSPKEGEYTIDNLSNGRFPQEIEPMEGIECHMNKMNPPQKGKLRGHGEHWIKIDNDYLVLEL